ncbi:M23 family metallopeptidase [Paenibacillus sp. A3]|uniref:M23 family metallopeptidase n=1 Tax=Paenibacillus sp. A3 TaxID=1337054 RepID=UPI0009EC9BAC
MGGIMAATTYAHQSQTTVRVGDEVQTGDVVGVCGSSGKSTSLHLHFEIFVNGQCVDPAPYIGLKPSDFWGK